MVSHVLMVKAVKNIQMRQHWRCHSAEEEYQLAFKMNSFKKLDETGQNRQNRECQEPPLTDVSIRAPGGRDQNRQQ